MKKIFQDLNPVTRYEILVRTMDRILEEEQGKEPKTDKKWLRLYHKACDYLKRKNYLVEVEPEEK